MAVYSKVVQSDGSWRLLDGAGNPIGRIWATAHVDRILRDGMLAEAVRDALAAGGSGWPRSCSPPSGWDRPVRATRRSMLR